MIYLYSFLFSGIVCLIAQLILDNTKLTPGHVTSFFTIIGGILSFLNVYDWFIKYCGAGATSVILNFGAGLYKGASSGLKHEGILGLFNGMFLNSSAILTATILFGFMIALFLKPKN